MFVGRYEDIIPFDEKELQQHLDLLKNTLESKEDHCYTNLEIVLFKTSEKLQEENTQLKKEKDILKKHLIELYNKIILEADKNGKLDLTQIKDTLLEIRQNFKSIN